MTPAGRGNQPEVGFGFGRKSECAATAGERQVGRTDEQAIDRGERRNGVDLLQRLDGFNHEVATGVGICQSMEILADGSVSPKGEGTPRADTARSKWRILREARRLRGMSGITDHRQHDAIGATVQRLLNKNTTGLCDPHDDAEPKRFALRNKAIAGFASDGAVLHVDDDHAIAKMGRNLQSRDIVAGEPESRIGLGQGVAIQKVSAGLTMQDAKSGG
mgnify:CR=1 FL=1